MALIGEAHPKSKLSNSDVLTIRKLHKQGVSMKLLAKNFKVSVWNVKSIVSRNTWKHL